MTALRSMAAVAVLALAGSARAQCLDGDYVVVGEPLFSSPGGAFADVVTIAGDTVSIPGACPAVRAQFRATSRGTIVRAAWVACGSFAQRMRLRAVVNKPCRTMRGRLVTRRPRAVRRFVAQRDVACEAGDASCGGCTRNADCAALEYCAKAPGACAANGSCEPRPVLCTRDLRPVCGCDGVTYSNPCDAAAHGTSIANDGRCAPTNECTDACDCYRTRTFPEPCLLECATCDNYWTCDDGACVPHCGPVFDPPTCEPRVCGGIAGLPCAPDELCELPKGECHVADAQGVCLPMPKLCPDLHAPVCGCDGVTYSNDCDRQVAGVQLGHEGPCGEPCQTACDCEKTPLPDWCALLLCPACGCGWVCERGYCAAHIFSPPPPSACQ